MTLPELLDHFHMEYEISVFRKPIPSTFSMYRSPYSVFPENLEVACQDELRVSITKYPSDKLKEILESSIEFDRIKRDPELSRQLKELIFLAQMKGDVK